jgi:hypothetical protein
MAWHGMAWRSEVSGRFCPHLTPPRSRAGVAAEASGVGWESGTGVNVAPWESPLEVGINYGRGTLGGA